MPLLARTVLAPIAIEVRPGAVDSLAPLLSDGRISTGGKVAVAVGPARGDAIATRLAEQLPRASIISVEGGTLESALQLGDHLRRDFHDAVVGIGGGRTLDAAKYAASLVGLPFVAVATTLTHDGLASPVATLDSNGRRASFGVHVPIAVFVDIDEVRDAPDRHLRSGVGDVLSNLSAIADWELARRVRGEPVDGLAVSLARTSAEAVIAADGEGDHFIALVADALIMSGLAMTMAGSSRPCSGACHEISHALDAYHGSPGFHGEQVALGALFASWLRARRGIADDDLFPRLDAAMGRFQLPRHPKELGVDAATFRDAVVRAPLTRPDRFTVLEHLDLDPSQTEELVDAFLATIDS